MLCPRDEVCKVSGGAGHHPDFPRPSAIGEATQMPHKHFEGQRVGGHLGPTPALRVSEKQRIPQSSLAISVPGPLISQTRPEAGMTVSAPGSAPLCPCTGLLGAGFMSSTTELQLSSANQRWEPGHAPILAVTPWPPIRSRSWHAVGCKAPLGMCAEMHREVPVRNLARVPSFLFTDLGLPVHP